MQVLRNNILFKPDAPKQYTNAGLLVPESVRQVRDRGMVIKIGAWVKHYKEGDIIHRVHNWGQEVLIDNEVYYSMDADSILAKE